MSEPRPARDVIAGVLGEHYWGNFWTRTRFEYRCRCGWTPVRPREQSGHFAHHFAHLTDALIAAGVTMPAPPAIPDRAFTDDYGRRWEWCGGTDGTWAWRITALPEPVPPRCTGRIGHRRCILDTGHRGGHRGGHF